MGSTAGTAGTATGSAPARRGGEVRIVLGLTCQLLAVLLMNQALFPLFDGVFTYTRDICIVFSAVCLIVLSVGVMRRPRLARGRTFDRACCAAAPVAFAGVVFGVLLHMPALARAGGLRCGALPQLGVGRRQLGGRLASG